MRGIVRSNEQRQQVVEAYRTSGLSVEAFAVRHGVAVSTMYGWLRAPREAPKAAPRIARVVVSSREVARDAETAVLLEYAGARVSVKRGFDRRVLVEVLSVLEQRR